MKSGVFRVLKHILIIAAGLFALLFLPFAGAGGFQKFFAGGVDAVSGASVTIDQPSGNYLVLINENAHPDKEKLAQWEDFFSGREVSYIMEDISCSVMSGDSGADTMAQSFQSRLSEHQMSIYRDDPTMLVSRADAGKFDIIILSKEYSDAYSALDGLGNEVKVLNVEGS